MQLAIVEPMHKPARYGSFQAASLLVLMIGTSALGDETASSPQPKPPPRIQALPKAAETKPEDQSRKSAPQESAATRTVVSLAMTVKLALMAEPGLAPFAIEVTNDGAVVVLSGKVASDTEATLAVNVAAGVPGVTSVTNKLQVAKDLKQTFSQKQDEMITAYVKERFERSTTLKSAAFTIKTEDGVVHLSGKTRFQVIALEAAETARQVPSVRAVRTEGVKIEAGE